MDPLSVAGDLADQAQRISATENGLTILILIVVFGFLVLGGYVMRIVSNANKDAAKLAGARLEYDQQRHKFEQETIGSLKSSFERMAGVLETDAEHRGEVVEAIKQITLTLQSLNDQQKAFGVQQAANVATLDKLLANDAQLLANDNLFEGILRGFAAQLEDSTRKMADGFKEITSNIKDAQAVLELLTSIKTVVSSIENQFHTIQEKVITQEMKAVENGTPEKPDA